MTTYRPAVGDYCLMTRKGLSFSESKPRLIVAMTDKYCICKQDNKERCVEIDSMSFQPLPNLEQIVDQIRNAETRAEAIQVARGYFDDTMHFGEVVER